MHCVNCGGELAKITRNRRKTPIISDLCVRCQLAKLGWKTDEKDRNTEKGLA